MCTGLYSIHRCMCVMHRAVRSKQCKLSKEGVVPVVSGTKYCRSESCRGCRRWSSSARKCWASQHQQKQQQNLYKCKQMQLSCLCVLTDHSTINLSSSLPLSFWLLSPFNWAEKKTLFPAHTVIQMTQQSAMQSTMFGSEVRSRLKGLWSEYRPTWGNCQIAIVKPILYLKSTQRLRVYFSMPCVNPAGTG